MSKNVANTFGKSDFTFYKKKLEGKVMKKKNILGHISGNSIVVTYSDNFNIYFTPFVRCFVQGNNLKGDCNKLCTFLIPRGKVIHTKYSKH